MSQRLKDKVDLLLLEIERNPGVNVTATQRYKDLIKALKAEYDKFAVYLETELEGIIARSEAQGKSDATALLVAALVAMGLQVTPAMIAQPPVSSVPSVLAPGSPAYIRLQELAGIQSQRVIDALIEGINRGYGYEKLGGLIVDELGLGLADALRWARTTQMEAYRNTSHETMLENGNIVDGWTWWAQIDGSVCDGCQEGHGTFHALDESLNDLTPHIWNCRCVELPHVVGDVNPITGEPTDG
jgi:SPP1 gp7 family putative phage head morphogenesis protein